jgi:hypothetical protein
MIISMEITCFIYNGDKKSERNAWEWLVVCLTYKVEIWIVFLAKLWPEIGLVKDRIWDVIVHESCRSEC